MINNGFTENFRPKFTPDATLAERARNVFPRLGLNVKRPIAAPRNRT